jgi:hypothetical protein
MTQYRISKVKKYLPVHEVNGKFDFKNVSTRKHIVKSLNVLHSI